MSPVSHPAERIVEAELKVAEAQSAAQEAQQKLTQAEARAESAEQAKIELSMRLAEVAASRDSAGEVSGITSQKPIAAGAAEEESLQKRYAPSAKLL